MEKQIAKFSVNGKPYEILIEPNMTLNEVLRDHLDLTGTKYSCGAGECGACTVLLDGKPILSCLTLAIAVREKDIVTIEGLAEGNSLHPIQTAFIEQGAIQCGFCSPGMILTAKALLTEDPNPTEEKIKEYLAGNLCRCTGYIKIIEAVSASAKAIGMGSESSGQSKS